MKRCSSQKIFLRGLINHACAFFIFFLKKTKKRNPTPTKSMCKSMYIEIVHFFYFCIYVIYIVILKKKYRVDPKQTVLYSAVTVATRTKCPLFNPAIQSLGLWMLYQLQKNCKVMLLRLHLSWADAKWVDINKTSVIVSDSGRLIISYSHLRKNSKFSPTINLAKFKN